MGRKGSTEAPFCCAFLSRPSSPSVQVRRQPPFPRSAVPQTRESCLSARLTRRRRVGRRILYNYFVFRMTPWQVCSSNSPPRHSQLGVHELSPLMPPQQRDCSTPQSSTSGGGSGSKIHVRSFRGTTSLRDDVPCSLQETSGHVRVMCPGLDASASFHMTNAQLGNVVTVGFLQVRLRKKIKSCVCRVSPAWPASIACQTAPLASCR